MMEISEKEKVAIIKFLENNLGHRDKVKTIISVIKNDKKTITRIIKELDGAIEMFNRYKHGDEVKPLEREDLFHANKLSNILEEVDLPDVNSMTNLARANQKKISKNITKLLDQYDFLDTMEPPERLTAAFLVLAYRSCMLVLYHNLRKNSVMVGSSLEEMFCVMAINGNKTLVFEAIKDWIQNNEEEGFSEELVKSVALL